MPPKTPRPAASSTRYTTAGLAGEQADPHAPPAPPDGRISAGYYPIQLILACRELNVRPDDLIDWALRRAEVSLILPDGSKARRPIEGEWVRGFIPKSKGSY